MTKDEIINCQDGQALADAVAVEVMGWTYKPFDPFFGEGWYKVSEISGDEIVTKEDWQPHLPTEKGKAQCWDLMIKCRLCVCVDTDYMVYPPKWKTKEMSGENMSFIKNNSDTWQIAVLKAALLSVKE